MRHMKRWVQVLKNLYRKAFVRVDIDIQKTNALKGMGIMPYFIIIKSK